MGGTGRRAAAGGAGLAAALALGIGIAAGQAGDEGATGVPGVVPHESCVLGPGAADLGPAWTPGSAERGDALNRIHGLGAYAPGGACSDLPRWFPALVLRSDALNRAEGIGRYSP